MQLYNIMLGDLDGFIKITQFIKPFDGRMVMSPNAVNTDSVEGLFGEQEVLTIQVEIPDENASTFEAFCAAIGFGEEQGLTKVETAQAA